MKVHPVNLDHPEHLRMSPSYKQSDETLEGCQEPLARPVEEGPLQNLRVLIADDEHLSRERIKRFLRCEPEIEIVAECASGAEAVAAIHQKSPDLAFLDVRMPEMDGFGVMQSLRGVRLPAIIFVTAYDHFALRAFEIDAVDYLLKPFDRQRFQAAIRRARHRLQLQSAPSTNRIRDELPEDNAVGFERIAVKSAGKILFLKTAEIDWVSAADNYVELHAGNRVHLLRLTICSFAKRLGEDRFVRISRSIIVRLEAIKELHSKSHGDFFVVLFSGLSLAGSRKYRSGLGRLL